jgi:hypothetical protein
VVCARPVRHWQHRTLVVVGRRTTPGVAHWDCMHPGDGVLRQLTGRGA